MPRGKAKNSEEKIQELEAEVKKLTAKREVYTEKIKDIKRKIAEIEKEGEMQQLETLQQKLKEKGMSIADVLDMTEE